MVGVDTGKRHDACGGLIESEGAGERGSDRAIANIEVSLAGGEDTEGAVTSAGDATIDEDNGADGVGVTGQGKDGGRAVDGDVVIIGQGAIDVSESKRAGGDGGVAGVGIDTGKGDGIGRTGCNVIDLIQADRAGEGG